MKRRCSMIFLACFGIALLSVSPVAGQGCFYAEFDEDGDPWTLRTELPLEIPEATLDLILEVPESAPLDQYFMVEVMGGCCDDIFNDAHYGAWVEPETVTFDPAVVDWYSVSLPTCTFCCAWIIDFHIRADATLVPGQRYFLAEATATVICEEGENPCFPPHDIALTYHQTQGGHCPDGESSLLMACPPTAAQPTTWGAVRGLYR